MTLGKVQSLALIAMTLFFSTTSHAISSQPKYGPEALLLSKSNDYFRSHPAPQFWMLMSHYSAQRSGNTCSVASLVMLINAGRAHLPLTRSDRLATEPGFFKKISSFEFKIRLNVLHLGISLDPLGALTQDAFSAYDIPPEKMEVIHTENLSASTRQRLHEHLMAFEKDSREFILANFLQSTYTGDADIGHIAPVGAYDAQNKKVLILDPDRDWYEPYWVSEETFLKGMATRDGDAFRGYIRIKMPVRQ